MIFVKLSDNCLRICPFDILLSEYSNLPCSIRQKLKQLYTKIDIYIVNVLLDGQNTNEFRKDLDPVNSAKIVLNSLSYSLKIAKMYNDINQINSVISMIKNILSINY